MAFRNQPHRPLMVPRPTPPPASSISPYCRPEEELVTRETLRERDRERQGRGRDWGRLEEIERGYPDA